MTVDVSVSRMLAAMQAPQSHTHLHTQPARYRYNPKVIQFGYIAMFSAACPPAALFAALANILELRFDARKVRLDRAAGLGIEHWGERGRTRVHAPCAAVPAPYAPLHCPPSTRHAPLSPRQTPLSFSYTTSSHLPSISLAVERASSHLVCGAAPHQVTVEMRRPRYAGAEDIGTWQCVLAPLSPSIPNPHTHAERTSASGSSHRTALRRRTSF